MESFRERKIRKKVEKNLIKYCQLLTMINYILLLNYSVTLYIYNNFNFSKLWQTLVTRVNVLFLIFMF